MAEPAENQNTTIKLPKEEEGTTIESLDEYIFDRIGSSIPLNPNSSTFNLTDPPIQALAVSVNPKAIFLAHSQGFYVVKTGEVVKAAKLMKVKEESCCIEELSVVDVQIGKVRILAVSKDSSTLAAAVGSEIRFFDTTSLLNKEQEPSYSCSINDSSYVKDFRWQKKLKTSFVVLSSDGKLYHGDHNNPLKEVMENVDAVDWSPEGNFIAVAKKDSIIICSSRFREKFTLSMPVSSSDSDADSACNPRVDSINWIRQDCIALGCSQVTDDDEEEGYVIKLISSKEGNIYEGSSKPAVLSFDEPFPFIDDNIVPSKCGPHLFLNYLEHREIALLANKKCTNYHIGLFQWSLDADQKEAALVGFSDDTYSPRIPIQENDDDNLIMGFGVDTTSLDEKVKVPLGNEQKELSPYCILFCLTLDEKLLMFYVAGQTESPDSCKIESEISDNDEDATEVISSNTSSLLKEERLEERAFDSQLPDSRTSVRLGDLSNKESTGLFSTPVQSAGDHQNKLQPLFGRAESSTHANLLSSVEKKNANPLSSNTEKSSEPPPQNFGSEPFTKDSRKPETKAPMFSSSGALGFTAFSGSSQSIFSSNIKGGNDGTSNAFPSLVQREGLQSSSSSARSSHKIASSEELNSRSSSSVVDRVEQPGFRLSNTVNVTGANSSLVLPRSNISTTKESNAVSQFSINTSVNSSPIGGLRPSTGLGKVESEPAMRSLQSSSYRGSSSQNPLESKAPPTGGNVRTSQSSYGTGSEREFSKHFGNVNEMSKELDSMLSQIEEEGGYRDKCIIFQKNSVLGIEQGLEDLTKRCREWKGKMEDRLEGIQNLLDQTVQVLARKVYIEGMVKQASDTQYWDLWNHQKLTPELELKRRQILKVNQNLTNQLIELERHFNTLELNKFGENNEVLASRRGFHSGSKSSRDGQAFHRLYNTMSSQLAVAEQLSESLTKQMEVLKIESPSARRKSVAKELFESIGLSYEGDSFKSPSTKKSLHSPDSVKKFQFSSVSTATKEQSRRNPSSVVKSFEPETARRRVSLDRSWASFEPPKTTVKRMLLQEERPTVTATKQSLVTNKEGLKLSSPVSHPRDHAASTFFMLSHTKNRSQLEADKVIQDIAPRQASSTSSFYLTSDFSGKSQSTNMKSPAIQVQQRENLISPSETQKKPNQSFAFAKSDNTKSQALPFPSAKPNFQSESKISQAYPNPIHTPPQRTASPKETPQMSVTTPPNLNVGGTSQVKASGSAFSFPSSPALDFQKRSSQPETLSKETQSGPAFDFQKKFSQPETISKETQSGVSTISPPTSIVSPSAPTPPIKPLVSESPTPSFSPPSILPLKSDNAIKPSTNDKLPSAPSFSSSSFSTPSFGPTTSFSSQTPNQQFQPSVSSATELKPISPPMESKSTVTDLNVKSDVNASQVSHSQPEPVPVAPTPSGFSFNNVSIGVKNETPPDVATQEDEMDEEAPDLNLGGFGGFGLGSAPTTSVTAPKPNPFGGAFLNTSPNPSPFNLSVPSGELFKPASFNIGQPIQPSQPAATQNAFGNSFTTPEPTRSGFGQSAQIGAGQQALGSVLGGFGQSRQLGLSPPGTGFASGGSSAFGTPPLGGFAGAAASGGGGFAAAASASAGGGFAATASSGGGFGAFGNQQGGGGFGGFGNQQQQGGGGFSAFGSSPAWTGTGNSLFTQMRK